MSASGKRDPLESWIHWLLQIGVAVSAALIGLGTVLWAITGNSGYGPDSYPVGLGSVVAGAVAGRPVAVIQAGLALLILTPIFRVGAAALLFIRQRDRVYAWLTLALFGVLMAMLLTGGGG